MSKGPARAKQYTPPKKAEPIGSYAVSTTIRTPGGQIQTHEVTIEKASGKVDAMNQHAATFHPSMTIVKASAFFIGLCILSVIILTLLGTPG